MPQPSRIHILATNASSWTIAGLQPASDLLLILLRVVVLSGVPANRQGQLWCLLCGLLVLGNVDFNTGGDDKAVVANTDVLVSAEELLGCSNLTVNLTTKESGRKSIGVLKLTKTMAEATRDAAIKDIYIHIFDWVVRFVA